MNQSIIFKKENLAPIGFVIINLAILFFGAWFLTSKIIEGSGQLAEAKGALEAIYKNWEQMSSAKNDLAESKPQIDKLSKAFISKTEPIGFINSLENLAQRTNNIIEIELKDQASGAKKKDEDLYFQIKLAGSFSDAMHFLNYIENMEYRVQVQSLDISKAGSTAPGASGGKDSPPNSVYTSIVLKAFTQ